MVARGALVSSSHHRTLMQPIRFAILGFGYHAAFRLVPSFRNCQHATLVGFHRRDPDKAARDAAAHGIRAFPSS